MSNKPTGKSSGTKSNLDKLREQYKKNQSEGGGNFNWWKPNWGDNTIRVLPPIDEENDLFYQEVGRHQIGEQWFYCLKYQLDENGKPKRCPACESRRKLFRGNDKSLVAIAKKIKAKKQYLMNVVDRKGEDETQVHLYAPGVKLWNKMVTTMLDDDIDITDVENGFDFLVKKEEGPKTEQGSFPSYDNSKAKRNSSKLNEDPKISKKILDSRIDLKSVAKFEEDVVIQSAIDEYLKEVTGGTSNDEFYADDEAKKDGDKPQKNQSSASGNIDKLKEKLHKTLRTDDVDDDDDSDEE